MSAFPGITAPPSQHSLKPLATPVVNAPNAQSLRQVEAHRPSRSQHQTERLPPVQKDASGGGSKRGLFIAAFVAAVLLGVGVVAVVGNSSGDAQPPKPIVVQPRVTPPNDGKKPVLVATARVDPPVVKDEPTPVPNAVIDAGEETVVVDSPPVVNNPKQAKVKQPKQPLVAKVEQPKADKPVEKPQDKPKADEAIPEGTGKLLVSVGDNQGSVSVAVAGEDWGQPPIQKKISSGYYRVSVKLSDGSASSFKATVMPDKTTVLTLDPSSGKWSSQFK